MKYCGICGKTVKQCDKVHVKNEKHVKDEAFWIAYFDDIPLENDQLSQFLRFFNKFNEPHDAFQRFRLYLENGSGSESESYDSGSESESGDEPSHEEIPRNTRWPHPSTEVEAVESEAPEESASESKSDDDLSHEEAPTKTSLAVEPSRFVTRHSTTESEVGAVEIEAPEQSPYEVKGQNTPEYPVLKGEEEGANHPEVVEATDNLPAESVEIRQRSRRPLLIPASQPNPQKRCKVFLPKPVNYALTPGSFPGFTYSPPISQLDARNSVVQLMGWFAPLTDEQFERMVARSLDQKSHLKKNQRRRQQVWQQTLSKPRPRFRRQRPWPASRNCFGGTRPSSKKSAPVVWPHDI